MIRKSISVILTAIFIFSFFTVGSVAYEPVPPNISVSGASAGPGEEVSLKVSIHDNPGINTFALGFDYDTGRLELTNVEVAPELGGQFTYSQKAVWLGGADTTYNGDILTLTFRVKDDAAAGDAKVAVTYGEGDIANYNEEDVAFDVISGKITVGNERSEPSAARITVSGASAAPGGTVSLKVSIEGNPGINTFALGFDYDTEKLELKKVGVSPELGGQFTYSNKAVWLGSADTRYNGEILTLIFKVKDDIEIKEDILGIKNESLAVSVTYAPGDISNYAEEDVDFALVPGTIGIWPDNPICPCSVFGKEHSWDDGKIVSQATCTDEGEIIYTCTVCNDINTEKTAKDPANHADHGTEIKNKKDATATEKGYTGDKVCKGCGAVIEKGKDIPASSDPEYMPGDVNGDGKILANDARLALRASAKLETLTDAQLLAADVDEDGKVLANDARQILRFSAKLQTEFKKAGT